MKRKRNLFSIFLCVILILSVFFMKRWELVERGAGLEGLVKELYPAAPEASELEGEITP